MQAGMEAIRTDERNFTGHGIRGSEAEEGRRCRGVCEERKEREEGEEGEKREEGKEGKERQEGEKGQAVRIRFGRRCLFQEEEEKVECIEFHVVFVIPSTMLCIHEINARTTVQLVREQWIRVVDRCLQPFTWHRIDLHLDIGGRMRA